MGSPQRADSTGKRKVPATLAASLAAVGLSWIPATRYQHIEFTLS
jgi:hypothetical protein